jgi:hypothetical protein
MQRSPQHAFRCAAIAQQTGSRQAPDRGIVGLRDCGIAGLWDCGIVGLRDCGIVGLWEGRPGPKLCCTWMCEFRGRAALAHPCARGIRTSLCSTRCRERSRNDATSFAAGRRSHENQRPCNPRHCRCLMGVFSPPFGAPQSRSKQGKVRTAGIVKVVPSPTGRRWRDAPDEGVISMMHIFPSSDPAGHLLPAGEGKATIRATADV